MAYCLLTYASITGNFMKQNAAGDRTTLLQIREALQQLLDDIPMFASWRIQIFEHTTNRYGELLLSMANLHPPHSRWETFLVRFKMSQDGLNQAHKAGDWRLFDQYFQAMRWDMDELLRLLS